MTTFMKAKPKKLNGQTHIEKYRVSVFRICQNIISKQNIWSITELESCKTEYRIMNILSFPALVTDGDKYNNRRLQPPCTLKTVGADVYYKGLTF